MPRNRKLTNTKNSKSSSDGVKNFPIRSTSLFGANASQLAVRKKTKEKRNINTVKFAFSGRYGATAISNGREAARGIPKYRSDRQVNQNSKENGKFRINLFCELL